MSAENRDRLNALAADLGFSSVEQTITYLIAEDWKSRCIAAADSWREQHPEQWRADITDADRLGGLRDGLDAA